LRAAVLCATPHRAPELTWPRQCCSYTRFLFAPAPDCQWHRPFGVSAGPNLHRPLWLFLNPPPPSPSPPLHPKLLPRGCIERLPAGCPYLYIPLLRPCFGARVAHPPHPLSLPLVCLPHLSTVRTCTHTCPALGAARSLIVVLCACLCGFPRDTRLGSGFTTVSTDFQKVFRMHDTLYCGLAGLGTDVQSL
jgi:hypothetical protein